MSCFPGKRELFLEFHDNDGDHDETIDCNCLQNCLDSNVVVEKFQVLKGTKQVIQSNLLILSSIIFRHHKFLGSIGGLIIMKKYPLIRYQREVIFTLTDFFGKRMKIKL